MLQAAILAAGEGVRLKAQGITTPKPLVPIAGVPMIERIIRQLRAVGADEVTCIISQDFPEVLAHLQARQIDLPASLVVKSTSNSFHSLCELIPFLQAGPFLVSLVDAIFNTRELERFVRYALQRPGLDALLAVTDFVENDTPLCLQLEKGNEVIAIGRDAETSPYITGGIYWFSARILDAVNQALAHGVSRMRNFIAFLFEQGYTLEGYWFRKIIDVDTVQDIELAEAIGENE
jgi:NDP-sugar pyrophosphorylase family protein